MQFSIEQLLLAYAGMSLITFVAYWLDKSAAKKNAWRIPEKTLHILSLACDWPGALFGQQLLRHKTQKQPFRAIFWLTVALNITAVLYFKFFQ
ncbi:MAG: DUF1294 domain-containing protein [Kangiellaceae bacterium]|nr:DUF1294 domain-containing protein [Kangiellaceae bacterium]